MNLKQFKKLDQAGRDAYGETLPMGATKDKDEKRASYRSDNSWVIEMTNSKNHDTTFASDGYWAETYCDPSGNEIANGYRHGWSVFGEYVTEQEFNKFIMGLE